MKHSFHHNIFCAREREREREREERVRREIAKRERREVKLSFFSMIKYIQMRSRFVIATIAYQTQLLSVLICLGAWVISCTCSMHEGFNALLVPTHR
jgi:hypothetical protein